MHIAYFFIVIFLLTTPAIAEETMATEKMIKTNEEWKQELSPELYHVAREKGTERPFTGKFDDAGKGTYVCAVCGAPLFHSDTKFESGTGWPSFYAPIQETTIDTAKDNSHFMQRTEVICNKCGAHLGHVFNDGPQDKTGMRYCINAVSLELKEDKADTEE